MTVPGARLFTGTLRRIATLPVPTRYTAMGFQIDCLDAV
jgi:hypothetical protein